MNATLTGRKAITRSALSSPTSRVSHFASSSCTRVGTSHCAVRQFGRQRDAERLILLSLKAAANLDENQLLGGFTFQRIGG